MVLKVDQLPGKQGRRLQLCQCWLIIQVMVRNRGQIDTTIEIITPENIAFRYRVAGPFRRLPAYLIDLAIRLTLAFGGMFLLSFAFGMIGWGGIGIGLGLILWFVLAWFYGGLFEAFWNGQTPGKRLLQIRVLAVDGRPINALQAVLRNILRAIDSAPPLVFFGQPIWFLGTYLVGLVAAATNNRFQRLGDLVCGTMVVLEERSMRLPALARADLPAVRKLEGLIPPSFQPDRSLSRALAAYVERRLHFSLARRHEIARHLGEPLRQRLGLPPGTNLDLLLCALYERAFMDRRAQSAEDLQTPFAAEPAVVQQPAEAASGTLLPAGAAQNRSPPEGPASGVSSPESFLRTLEEDTRLENRQEEP